MRFIKRVWKNYSLSITLLTFFLFSLLAQGIFQWQEFVNTQQEHNQPVKVEEFQSELFARIFENWQSEFLQLFAMVVLTSFLSHKGSPESRDSEEKIERKLQEIAHTLKELQTKRRSSKRG
jgi:hypothetical protein